MTPLTLRIDDQRLSQVGPLQPNTTTADHLATEGPKNAPEGYTQFRWLI